MFDKVLIANRGEIAIRVIRGCHQIGIQTVAIYAEDDRESLHVKLAQEAYILNGQQLSETYLNIKGILEIAKRAGAQAIHPGYGFLSENADFAQACEEAGITFIGPKSTVIRQMGSKIGARQIMEKADVPITPGSPPLDSFAEASQWADKIKYPVLLKASAGGGGRGMKKVMQADQLEAAFEAAKRESLSYFGDGTVYLEKLVQQPRHIEVQILGDSHGNVIHLGERDCSVQRRNQKLVEESPAPHLPTEVRNTVLEAAVKGAKALNYTGAGTFEFVVENNRDVYFMEVNTRLQVEHPVTEMVTGVDLVAEQLKIAFGQPMSYTQDQIHFKGHAIECRITAEDANLNFRPVAGQVGKVAEPHGPWVRVDSMLQANYALPQSYDSMVAKLICWGITREAAIGRLKQALSEYQIEGLTTLIPFYQWICQQADFVSGHYDTGFIAAHFKPEMIAPAQASEIDNPESPTRQLIELEVNGKRFEVTVYGQPGFNASPETSPTQRTRIKKAKKAVDPASQTEILAPMAGTVVKLAVEAGQEIETGQVVCVIESMKMENDIASARTGKIKRIAISAGEKIQQGTLILEFD